MTQLALLGTGLIGASFARSLRDRGDEVTVWNRTLDKAQALADAGVRVAADPAEAVRGAARVHLALSADAAVDDVIARILPELAPAVSARPAAAGEHPIRPILIDHSTVSPRGAAARAERLRAAGVDFLHAPIFMSPQAARTAGGMMLACGPAAVFRRAEAGLRAMTGDLWYLGERTDQAAAFKLFGNAMLIAIAAGLADVLAMARALGIEPTEAHGLFSRFKPGGAIELRGARMARGDFAATFELTMARKDVQLMIDAAGDAPLAVLPAILARADELIGRGHGADDLGVLALDAVPHR